VLNTTSPKLLDRPLDLVSTAVLAGVGNARNTAFAG
jgi:hypothetical protein